MVQVCFVLNLYFIVVCIAIILGGLFYKLITHKNSLMKIGCKMLLASIILLLIIIFIRINYPATRSIYPYQIPI